MVPGTLRGVLYTSWAADPEAAPGRERALAHLREVVVADPDAEGTCIDEERVAQAIGVSRTPVREALLVPAPEGLVELRPRRGAAVTP